MNDLKKIVRDDVAQNCKIGDFNYNFRLATKDGLAVSAVFSEKNPQVDAYFCEYMLADQENYTRPKGIATYLNAATLLLPQLPQNHLNLPLNIG